MVKMNKLLVLVSALLLSACTPSYTDDSQRWLLPPGMEDCKVYYLQASVGGVTVVRCPNSNTTTLSGGKSKKSVTITE